LTTPQAVLVFLGGSLVVHQMLQAQVWRIVGTGDSYIQTQYIKMMRMTRILREMIWQMVGINPVTLNNKTLGSLMPMLITITNITISQGLEQEALVWDRNNFTQPLVSDPIS
jgi:hypothetical protein